MATLTAEATLSTSVSVDCGHHLATPRGAKQHITEFRKPVSIKRNSKTAETETTQNIFDSEASSGMGAWESVLDYDQYNFDTTDKQTITLAADADIDTETALPSGILTDSGRIGVVFDFTEYYQCTPTVAVSNIDVKYTADGTGTLELRTFNATASQSLDNQLYVDNVYVVTDYIDETDSPKEYTTSLSNYSIDDGFVTVWFKGAGIQISNISARIRATGKTKASLTPVIDTNPVIYNDVIETEETLSATNPYERDTVISFDDIDLSAWPTTFQNDNFNVDSLVNFIGIIDNNAIVHQNLINYANVDHPFGGLRNVSASRAQATEDVNLPTLNTNYERSPATQLQLTDNRPELLSNNIWQMSEVNTPLSYIEWDSNLYSGFDSTNFTGATISVFWYGTTIPVTFIHADDPNMYYNVSLPISSQLYTGTETLFEQGDRSIEITSLDASGKTFQFQYPANNTKAKGNTALNFVTARWNNPDSIITEGWNNFTMSFTTGNTPTVKAYFNGVAASVTTTTNVPEAPQLDTSTILSSDIGIIAGKTSIHAQYLGVGSTATGFNLSGSYPRQHGTSRGENGAFFFVDDQFVDLDVQSNRRIFRNADGTPTTAPKINAQTPKIFISGDDRTINNNGVRPNTKENVQHQSLSQAILDTIVGGAPTARILGLIPTSTDELGNPQDFVGRDRDSFEGDVNYPVITYNKIQPIDFSTRTRTSLNKMGVDLAYVYPAQGTFQDGFVKSKLLLNLALTTGNIAVQSNFTVSQPDITMTLLASKQLDTAFDFDTTTGKIHLFRFDPLSLDTAFTTQQSASRLITGTVDTVSTAFSVSQPTISYIITAPNIEMNSAFATQQTGHRRISDSAVITLPITTSVTTEGKIFRFEPVTLAASFNIPTVTATIPAVRGEATLNTAFDVAVDGGIELTAGLITLDTAFTTQQSGKMTRTATSTMATAFTTQQSGKMTRGADATLATAFATQQSGKIFRFDPLTLTSTFTFTPETARIHLFRFVPRTFTINTTFTPESGRIHLFNLPAITLNAPFTADFRGGIQQTGDTTLFPAFELDVFAPIPLAPITLATAVTLSQPTVEIVKQANKIFVPAQQRIRTVRPHPRTIEAERLETVTSSGVDEWQDVAQWLDFDDFNNRHSISHRVAVTQNRTVEADVHTRTLTVIEVDRDDVIEVATTTYTVPQHQKTISTTAQTRTITATHTRTVDTATSGRTVDAERLT